MCEEFFCLLILSLQLDGAIVYNTFLFYLEMSFWLTDKVSHVEITIKGISLIMVEIHVIHLFIFFSEVGRFT